MTTKTGTTGSKGRPTREQIWEWVRRVRMETGKAPTRREIAVAADRAVVTIDTWIKHWKKAAEGDPRKKGPLQAPTLPPVPVPKPAPQLLPPAEDAEPLPEGVVEAGDFRVFSGATLKLLRTLPDDFDQLNDRHQRCVELSALGRSPKEIASTLGVSRLTVTNWLQRPAVAKALADLRKERHIAAKVQLALGAQEAVLSQRVAAREVRKILMDEDLTASVRLRAADVLNRLNTTLFAHGGYPKTDELILSRGVDEDRSLDGVGTKKLAADVENLQTLLDALDATDPAPRAAEAAASAEAS